MANRVREDDEILGRVERLAWSEQLAGKVPIHHGIAGAVAPVQHQHRLAGRRAEGEVVQLELGQDLAGLKLEVFDYPFARLGLRGLRTSRQVAAEERYTGEGAAKRRDAHSIL